VILLGDFGEFCGDFVDFRGDFGNFVDFCGDFGDFVDFALIKFGFDKRYTCHLEGQLGWEEKGQESSKFLMYSFCSTDFSSYSSKIQSFVEEKQVWIQEFKWNDQPVVQFPFYFPHETNLNQIREHLQQQQILFCSESQ
jgi:hypothetical protein